MVTNPLRKSYRLDAASVGTNGIDHSLVDGRANDYMRLG